MQSRFAFCSVRNNLFIKEVYRTSERRVRLKDGRMLLPSSRADARSKYEQSRTGLVRVYKSLFLHCTVSSRDTNFPYQTCSAVQFLNCSRTTPVRHDWVGYACYKQYQICSLLDCNYWSHACMVLSATAGNSSFRTPTSKDAADVVETLQCDRRSIP